MDSNKKIYYIVDAIHKYGPFDQTQVLDMLFSGQISMLHIVLNIRTEESLPLSQHSFYQNEVTQLTTIKNLNTSAIKTDSSLSFQDLRNTYLNNREKRIQSAIAASKVKPTNIITHKMPLNLQKPNATHQYLIKVKDKTLGPLSYLMLLTLIKNKKINTTTQIRSEFEENWFPVGELLPNEFIDTISALPTGTTSTLDKAQWQRKNIRIDYNEIVLIKVGKEIIVGKAVDLSSEGIALIGPPILLNNKSVDLHFFDLNREIVVVNAELFRQESLDNTHATAGLQKNVFVFSKKISMKSFVE